MCTVSNTRQSRHTTQATSSISGLYTFHNHQRCPLVSCAATYWLKPLCDCGPGEGCAPLLLECGGCMYPGCEFDCGVRLPLLLPLLVLLWSTPVSKLPATTQKKHLKSLKEVTTLLTIKLAEYKQGNLNFHTRSSCFTMSKAEHIQQSHNLTQTQSQPKQPIMSNIYYSII